MNKKKIILFLGIFIAVFSCIICKTIGNLDELWNYNTARVISNGMIPYKDVSMITTPFLPFITGMIFKAFTSELLVSRVIASLVWTGIFYLTYEILNTAINKKKFCFIILGLMYYICKDYICIDYNVLILFETIIIIYLEIQKNLKQNKNDLYNIIIGFTGGIAFCTKQSIGILIIVCLLGINLLELLLKKDKKEFLKSVVYKFVGVIIPIIVFFIYLFLMNSINDFINYAILGIKTFSNSVSYLELFLYEKIKLDILAIFMPIMLIYSIYFFICNSFISKKNDKESICVSTTFLYSLPLLFFMYPIADDIHFTLGIYVLFIESMFLVFQFIKYLYQFIKVRYKKKVLLFIETFLTVFTLLLIVGNAALNYKNYICSDKTVGINHYKFIPIQEYLSKRINKIDEYIIQKQKEGKKVYILDAEAVVYNIPLDIYNKDYDMFLIGNIGKDGQEGQIERIKNKKEEKLYLIKNRKLEQNWQTPLEVVNYIRDNLEYVEDISIYEVYK